MKLLAFVDTHGNMKAIEQIVQKAIRHKADLLVCAGDVSIFEQRIDKIFSRLNSLKIPVLFVPGNHESRKRTKELCQRYKNMVFMDRAMLRIKDYVFMGMSSDGFSVSDPEFREWSEKVKRELIVMQKKEGKRFKIILITHAPPHNTRLDNLMGSHCGNKDIRRFIESNNIYLSISGHIHENAGKIDMIKKTQVVNPGPYGRVILI